MRTNLIGKEILDYKIVEIIGAGSFANVYKAVKKNKSGEYIRALKHITVPNEKQYRSVLNSMGGDVSKANDYFDTMLENIVGEIKILNNLTEKGIKNVVRYYENKIDESDDPKRYDVFIFMEYLTPLEKYIDDNNFTVLNVVNMGLDILNGLKVCHENGIIHRDIKEDNIFLTGDGVCKIGDFGVSKELKGNTLAESVKGTPNYLAPEVQLGKGGYTQSVDLYSLGIVLYRLLNYSRNPFLPQYPEPYFSEDEDKAYEKRMNFEQPDLPYLGGNAIGQVIIKAILRKEDRYKTAEEFYVALKDAFEKTEDFILEQQIGIDKLPTEDNGCSSKNDLEGTVGVEFEPAFTEGPNKNIEQKNILPFARTIDNGIDNQGKQKMDSSNDIRKEPEAIDKNIVAQFYFVIPIILLLVGVGAYFIIIPELYGKGVSLIECLVYAPVKIINDLRTPSIVFSNINYLIGITLFWWLWLASFITSLFFLGKQLQNKKGDKVGTVCFKRIEICAILQEVYLKLKDETSIDRSILRKLLIDIKSLEEYIAAEKEFGYGGEAITKQELLIIDSVNCINQLVNAVNLRSGTADLVVLDNEMKKLKNLLLVRSRLN